MNNKFIEECKKRANANRLGKVLVPKLNSASGNNLTLDNTIEYNVEKLKIKGYTKQVTTTGKNIFNSERISGSETLNGITFSYDKSNQIITLNGTCTANNTTFSFSRMTENVDIDTKIVGFYNGGSVTGYCVFRLFNKDYSKQTALGLSGLNSTDNKKIVNATEEYEPGNISIRLDNGTVANNFSFKLMITKSDNTEWEPFSNGIPSPSPDYPQPVEVINGNIFSGKNLKVGKFPSTTVGEVLTYKDSSYSNCYEKCCYLEANEEYVISYKKNTPSNTTNRYSVLINDKSIVLETPLIWDNTKEQIKYTPKSSGWLVLVIDKNTTNLKIQKGSIVVKSNGENLFDKDNVRKGYRLDNAGNYYYQKGYNATEFINVTPNTSYSTSWNIVLMEPVCLYDKEQKFIKRLVESEGYEFVTTNETYYIKAAVSDSNLSTAQIQKGKISTHYKPYQESKITYSLGEEFLVEEDYVENDKLYKNVEKIVLNGSETWNIDVVEGTKYRSFFTVSTQGIAKPEPEKAYCNKLPYIKGADTYYKDVQGFTINYAGVIRVKILDATLTTIDSFKAWLAENPLEVYYQLKEPRVVELEPIGELKTFDGTTYMSNNVGTDMELKYNNMFAIENKNYLQKMSIDSGCYVDGHIIGSVYVKCLTCDFLSVPEDVDLIDKSIRPLVGVKYDDDTTEYIEMGKYTVERPKDEETLKMSQIKAYDDLNEKLDSEYICGIDYSKDNIKLKDLYKDVCDNLGLIPLDETFINEDIPIKANPFTNKEKNRIVLESVAKVSCSYVVINDENKIKLSWLSQSAEPDYIFKKNDYVTLEGGKIKFGPVNNVVIKNSQIDDENVSKKDEESIKQNGEHSVIISEDYILYNAELREQAITEIFNRLKGLSYVDSKLLTYYGKPFLKLGSKIRIEVDDNKFIDTYNLTHSFSYDGTFESTIASPVLTNQEIKTKQDISLGQALRNTQIEVNKQDGKIRTITEQTKEINDNLTNNYYTINQTNELIQTAETGITNTFSESGGNNILRNTGLWFENDGEDSETNPYEYWQGKATRKSNEKAINSNSIVIQKGSFVQEQEVPNGIYSICFKYKKLIELAKTKVKINDFEYDLASLQDKEFYTGEKDSETGDYVTQPLEVSSRHINIEFISDTNNALEVYDLMCNKGNVKLAYSQNQNETTTDTVNISKGITITSSNIDVIFRANADGIRLYTLQGEVKTRFTDKGMSTKEAIIEDEAQICGTLIQEVDDQTWWTRM